MAKKKGARKGFCSLTAIIGWVALVLGIGLVVIHVAFVGFPQIEGSGQPVPSATVGRKRELREQDKQKAQASISPAKEDAPSPASAPQPPRPPQPVPHKEETAAAPPAAPQAQAFAPAPPPLAPAGPDPRSPDLIAWEDSDENNAKRPPPRPGDYEIRSTVPDVLPGAGPGHLHGLLGRNPDGTEKIPPTPLPAGGLTNEDRRDAHRGFCFNSRVSDSLSLDRPQQDHRSPACRRKHEQYPQDLPIASVVIVFHNENFSILVRSVHSVLNHAPPHLLKEVIVVDDASVPVSDRFYEKHWKRLQEELTDYLMSLPKLVLVRLKERRGLMVARMEGIWRATADVTVFLDSHIEATPGYLEAMLARIKETEGRSVVVPSIDSIGNEDFSYRAGGGLGVLGFSWTLGQMPAGADNGPDGTRPARSPVMAGGLLASDRKWFLKLGGYDPEMRLYGGEEMEIGFRTWMCGGAIEYVPCSHVGHVFRTPAYWQGQVYKVPGEEIARNKLRTALVWMDDYAKLVEYASSPLPQSLPMGDLEPRKQLRNKLQCKDFNWYIRHVVPNMFAPKLTDEAKGGCLQNNLKTACVDTLGNTGYGAELGGYPCHYQHGTQALVLDSDGLVRIPQSGYQECLAVGGSNKVVQQRCNKVKDLLWKYDATTQEFISQSTNACLTFVDKPTDKSPFSVMVEACVPGREEQKWVWA